MQLNTPQNPNPPLPSTGRPVVLQNPRSANWSPRRGFRVPDTPKEPGKKGGEEAVKMLSQGEVAIADGLETIVPWSVKPFFLGCIEWACR